MIEFKCPNCDSQLNIHRYYSEYGDDQFQFQCCHCDFQIVYNGEVMWKILYKDMIERTKYLS